MSRHRIDEYLRAGRAPAALLRLGVYGTVLFVPLLVAVISEPRTDHPFVQELAKNFGMIGYSMLALQFILSARFRWIERPFGLDIVFRYHRSVGVLAAAFLLVHPVLYASAGEWDLLFTFDHGWEISLGKVALLALGALVVSSVFRKALSLEFETWRGVHNGLALSVLFLGFVHSMKAGGDFDRWPMMTLWTILLVFTIASYLEHKWLHPSRLRRCAYEVVGVERETHNVWSLELAPGDDTPAMDNLPGQFGFLTLHRDGRPDEEHPFTIASTPGTSGHVVTTIKASGDYTATIAQTRVGDRASLRGPYGRFSYVLHPTGDLVFVAGGVGITPMLSMLRHMRKEGSDLSVVLLYGNRHERDIIARTELERIAEGDRPKVRIVHVLSEAADGWTGETGRIDSALLQRSLDSIDQKTFYVCGPPAMTAAVTVSLSRHFGVPERSIHIESFSL